MLTGLRPGQGESFLAVRPVHETAQALQVSATDPGQPFALSHIRAFNWLDENSSIGFWYHVAGSARPQDLEIMVAAVVIACVIMYVSSKPVARFVAEHPTTKMLALAFLVLIGLALVADGFKFHIPRGYIYFAITFSAAVEFFNVLAKRNRKKAAK